MPAVYERLSMKNKNSFTYLEFLGFGNTSGSGPRLRRDLVRVVEGLKGKMGRCIIYAKVQTTT